MGVFFGLVFLLAWIIGMIRIIAFCYRGIRAIAAGPVLRWRARAPPPQAEPPEPPSDSFGGRV